MCDKVHVIVMLVEKRDNMVCVRYKPLINDRRPLERSLYLTQSRGLAMYNIEFTSPVVVSVT